MKEECEGGDIDGVPGLIPSFGCIKKIKKKKYLFNMLALVGVVVDETEPLCKIAGT